jgi:hypothetical protein
MNPKLKSIFKEDKQIVLPVNTIKLREYMCISGTDALASASVWVKLKHHFQEQKCLT